MYTIEMISNIIKKSKIIDKIGMPESIKILASLVNIERDMREQMEEGSEEHYKTITLIRSFIPELRKWGVCNDKSPFKEKMLEYSREYLTGDSDYMGVHDLTTK